MEERPWAQWGRSRKAITDIGLARLLKPFNVRSKNIRVGNTIPKGYEREPIRKAWLRYRASGLSTRYTATNQ